MKKAKNYTLKPARGQALLNYQGRKVATEMPLFETDVVEQVRAGGKHTAGARNLLLQGDCLSACAYLKAQEIAVDLVYIDPPFDSGAKYAKKIFPRNRNGKELKNGASSIGEEVMYDDIWQKEDYLNWLYERLLAIREIMSESGSIYVHLDWHIGHYVKVMMDEIFGEDNFRNEIVWCYKASNTPVSKGFPRKHDVILFYAKSPESAFNPQFSEYDPDYLKEKYKHKDENGRYYRKHSKRADGAERRVYLDEAKGVPVLSWWTDIPGFGTATRSSELVDYSTQKPKKLLDRIIRASSDEGMTVADFYVGSGTTAKAAHALNRRFIACDIGLNAIQTTRDGLREAGADFDHLKIRDGVRLIRNPAQTREKIFALIPGYQSREELGLGEFWSGGIVTTQGRHTPVYFPGIAEKVTRELIDVVLEEVAAATDAGKDVEAAIVIYAAKAANVDQAYADKAAHKSRRTDVRIRLCSLNELLGDNANQLHAQDSAEVVLEKPDGAYRVTIKKFFSPYLKAKIDEYNARHAQAEIDKEKPPVKISEHGLELIESVQFDTAPPRKSEVWKSDPKLEDRPKKTEQVKGEYVLDTATFRLKIRNIAGDEIIIDSSDLQTRE